MMLAPIDTQPLSCPGISSYPYPIRAAGVELTDLDARKLALAVAARALRDARSDNYLLSMERKQARAWLAEDGAAWLQALGYRVTQAMIDAFLTGDSVTL